MEIRKRKLKGTYEITLKPREDERGFFMRTHDTKIFDEHRIEGQWVQENHSQSINKGLIRGLHFQYPPYAETKLIRVVRGMIMDVFVDLRKGSETFGKWDSIELSDKNKKMVLVPQGFAHGFCTLTDECDVLYKVDSFYHPEAEGGIIWNDETLKINWPVEEPIISQKDANLNSFNYFVKTYGGIVL